MSFPFGDGFDHYTTADITTKWDSTGGAGSLSIDATGGRNGKGCLTANKAYVQKSVVSGVNFILAFALKLVDAGTGGDVVMFRDSITNNSLIALRWATDNKLKIVNPNDNSILAAPSTTISTGTWNYIEIKVSIGSSIAADSCVLRVNQAVAATVAAATNTRWGSATAMDVIQLGSISGALNAFNCKIDDSYIINMNDGVAPLDFLGDLTAEAIYPNAQGNYSDFSPNGSAFHYLCVNEHPPDGDTTYCSSNTDGQRESYTMTGTTDPIASVKAVQFVITARKQGSGSRKVAGFVRASGVNYDNSDVALGTSYTMTRQVVVNNPATSAAWTSTEIASMEVGYKASS